MPTFLAMATQPDGKLVQIGDTYVVGPRVQGRDAPAVRRQSGGVRGTPARQRIAVYSAGYVFGRSGWGTAATFADQVVLLTAVRPRHPIHGHADHMGLTYYARGRNLIVDAGHTGYEQDAYRSYLLSPEAASVLVMPGVLSEPVRADHADPPGHRVAGGQFYEFADTAFGGHARYRSVYVDQDPDLVLVFDRASGAAPLRAAVAPGPGSDRDLGDPLGCDS